MALVADLRIDCTKTIKLFELHQVIRAVNRTACSYLRIKDLNKLSNNGVASHVITRFQNKATATLYM